MSPDGLVLPVAGTLLAKTGVGTPVTYRDTHHGAEPSSSATALNKGLSRLARRHPPVGCWLNASMEVFNEVMVARNRFSAPVKQENCGPLRRPRSGMDGQPSLERTSCLWQEGMTERSDPSKLSRSSSGLRAAGRQVPMAEDVPCP
jgi:hypothetical protein